MPAHPAPLHPLEAERLAALDLLEPDPSDTLDQLVELVAQMLDVPIVLVSLVGSERQHFIARTGLETSSTPRDVAFCPWAFLETDGVLEVPSASQDPRFADNPLVTGPLNIESYAGVTLATEDGLPLGTLCAIGHEPRTLSTDERELLQAFAHHVQEHLHLARHRDRALATEAELRTQVERQGRLTRVAHRTRAMLVNDLHCLVDLQAMALQDLASQPLHPDVRAIYEELHTTNRKLETLTKALIDGVLTSNPLQTAAVPVGVVLRPVVEATLPDARQLGVHLGLRGDLRRSVVVDAAMMRRALITLLERVLPFVPRDTTVTLRIERDHAGREHLFVTCPSALPPLDLHRAPDLAFCFGVAEAHGGAIDIDHQDGSTLIAMSWPPLPEKVARQSA
jgi:GAF domain-containing protein